MDKTTETVMLVYKHLAGRHMQANHAGEGATVGAATTRKVKVKKIIFSEDKFSKLTNGAWPDRGDDVNDAMSRAGYIPVTKDEEFTDLDESISFDGYGKELDDYGLEIEKNSIDSRRQSLKFGSERKTTLLVRQIGDTSAKSPSVYMSAEPAAFAAALAEQVAPYGLSVEHAQAGNWGGEYLKGCHYIRVVGDPRPDLKPAVLANRKKKNDKSTRELALATLGIGAAGAAMFGVVAAAELASKKRKIDGISKSIAADLGVSASQASPVSSILKNK